MLPWAARNQIVLGSPIFLRSNFGLELQIANNNYSGTAFADNGTSFKQYHPFVNSSESEKVRRLGETAYMREKLDSATGWISAHPRRFALLSASRVFHFWFARTYRPAQTVVVWLLTFAACAGLLFAWKRQRPAFWLLGSIWFSYPLVYYLVQLDNPYRYPIYWTLLLLAAYGCIELVTALKARRTPGKAQVRVHAISPL